MDICSMTCRNSHKLSDGYTTTLLMLDKYFAKVYYTKPATFTRQHAALNADNAYQS